MYFCGQKNVSRVTIVFIYNYYEEGIYVFRSCSSYGSCFCLR